MKIDPTPTLQSPTAAVVAGPRAPQQRRMVNLLASVMVTAGVLLTVAGPAQAQNWRGLVDDSSISAGKYGRNEAMRAGQGRIAEVVQVRAVQLENTNRVNFGALLGAALGNELGNQVKDRDARRLARVAGAGIGGAVGYKTQRRMSREQGVLITVMAFDRRGNPTLTNIVQADDQAIRPGDFVMVTGTGNRTSIVPLDPEVQQRLRAGAQAQQQAQPSEAPRQRRMR